jgi:hypothetical protein
MSRGFLLNRQLFGKEQKLIYEYIVPLVDPG